jgi:hypothetical protein
MRSPDHVMTMAVFGLAPHVDYHHAGLLPDTMPDLHAPFYREIRKLFRGGMEPAKTIRFLFH